jgi:hypothetical protein
MSTQVVIVTTSGQLVNGINYRMDPGVPPRPSTPDDPSGGMYHVQGPNGWIDVPAYQVHGIALTGGVNT